LVLPLACRCEEERSLRSSSVDLPVLILSVGLGKVYPRLELRVREGQPQTWHYGVVARWWAEFNTSGPEIAYLQQFIEGEGSPRSTPRVAPAACETYNRADGPALPPELAAEMERLAVYADAQERKASQLQYALDSRVAIEQANGMLAERFDLQFVEAFELLRSAARSSRKEVRAIAEELRASRRTPEEIVDVLPSDLERREGPALRSMRGGRAD